MIDNKTCKKWHQRFKDAGIEFIVYNKGYHFKVDQWNFYPTRQSYWNSFTKKKGYWKDEWHVKKLIESETVSPEGVFNAVANNMMVRWDYDKFKRTHPHLHTVIIESMKMWANKE